MVERALHDARFYISRLRHLVDARAPNRYESEFRRDEKSVREHQEQDDTQPPGDIPGTEMRRYL